MFLRGSLTVNPVCDTVSNRNRFKFQTGSIVATKAK